MLSARAPLSRDARAQVSTLSLLTSTPPPPRYVALSGKSLGTPDLDNRLDIPLLVPQWGHFKIKAAVHISALIENKYKTQNTITIQNTKY